MNSQRITELFLSLVPEDGSTIGNTALRRDLEAALKAEGITLTDDAYWAAHAALIGDGVLLKGQGRGGSVRRNITQAGTQGGDDFKLQQQAAETGASKPWATVKAKAKVRANPNDTTQVISYRHLDKRVNNPEVGMVTPATDPDEGKVVWAYDPHIDPALQFDPSRARIEALIDDALASGDKDRIQEALEELKRLQSPYLNWAGKAERTSFEIDTVSLHVHERIDPASLLAAVRKGLNQKGDKPASAGKLQFDLFNAPFENLPLRDAIDFYRHERGWANRLIAGDSLLVMNSLLQKESLAGRVQMIYIDPPYGIKYGSNFQPFVGKRDVKDRNDADLTQEPEMLKAFRDTWELGIHSYLTYLRDRLLLARELLHESGSVFVQIGDENLHHVREIMGEVFGTENFVSLITFKKTAGQTSLHLPGTTDFIIWYAKSLNSLKFRMVFRERSLGDDGADAYTLVRCSNGKSRRLSSAEMSGAVQIDPSERPFRYQLATSQREGRPSGEGSAMHFAVQVNGEDFFPTANRGWTATAVGMARLVKAGRMAKQGTNATYVRYLDDFPAVPITNFWADTQSGSGMDKVYVVQTSQKIIERCLLMTTDPGDLVLDPTCGSGTTAFVAEKWGRRWITCDTSRVAVTLAKQRLMTASYDYYELRHPHEGLKGGFIYKTVPHVTLKSIANNPDIDTIYEQMHPAIVESLAHLNEVISHQGSGARGQRAADSLAPEHRPLQEWEVPYEIEGLLSKLPSLTSDHSSRATAPTTDPCPLTTAFTAFHAARQAMQKQMDASIAAHADQETLYDQPAISKHKLRISGPFTVEAVPFPTVKSLDEASGPEEADASIARTGESGRQHQWRDELLKTGIRGKDKQMLRFADLEALPSDQDIRNLHATGHLESGERVVISFGPEYAALEQRQVSNALIEAGHLFPLPKMIVFCAFMFDPEAAKDIDAIKGITALKAQMNTDLLTEDLKKNRARNESYWLMGQPEVEVFSLAFLVFGERRLCAYDRFAELSGLDCLAEIHGFGREDLFLYALLAQGRAVWDYLANAQGWDLHTGEYRRGTGKKRPGSESSGIPAVSWHGERLVGGVGDLDFALRQAGLPGLGEFRDVIAGLRRHSETPCRLAQVAHALDFPLSQLVTENTQLTTFHQVEVRGFDYFDTVKGKLVSGGKSKIAMWALDTDYDERSLFPRQVFFPMAGKGEGWEKLKKNIRAELDESRLHQFQGTVSLPFEAGDNRKIAVKIIDDRGIESLKVMSLN